MQTRVAGFECPVRRHPNASPSFRPTRRGAGAAPPHVANETRDAPVRGPAEVQAPPDWIELRSDTFTLPTAAMRAAIADAVVGDDMVGEDPTVNELERRLCELTGKDAAVFTCTATQANQVAIWARCRAGDALLIESSGHIANWEAGGPAALSGVTVRTLPGHDGFLSLESVVTACHADDVHKPPPRLLCLENTANMAGGRVWPIDRFEAVAACARQLGLAIHLDGARLFNAAVACGETVARLCAAADTAQLCFSKGLGCPMGAALVGDATIIRRARRARKVFGGSLRQAGMMAAAALHAIEHHVERLADDHANARRLADGLATMPRVQVDREAVDSNMVFFEIDGDAAAFQNDLHSRGVRLFATGPRQLRAVTHLDVGREAIDHAVDVVREVLAS